MMMRLNRFLAMAGVASRRKADELIASGNVRVNETKATVGMVIDENKDRVTVKGHLVNKLPETTYLLANKPVGVVTTTRDELGRKTILELVPKRRGRLYPVGRLDIDSEGLVLLTNDGELTQKLTHPSQHVAKTYEVWVRGRVAQKQLQQLRRGVRLKEGVTAPAEVEVIERVAKQTRLKIVLSEGKNRQIRRMLGHLDLPVERLIRIAIGKLTLAELQGKLWKELDRETVHKLVRGKDLSDG